MKENTVIFYDETRLVTIERHNPVISSLMSHNHSCGENPSIKFIQTKPAVFSVTVGATCFYFLTTELTYNQLIFYSRHQTWIMTYQEHNKWGACGDDNDSVTQKLCLIDVNWSWLLENRNIKYEVRCHVKLANIINSNLKKDKLIDNADVHKVHRIQIPRIIFILLSVSSGTTPFIIKSSRHLI